MAHEHNWIPQHGNYFYCECGARRVDTLLGTHIKEA